MKSFEQLYKEVTHDAMKHSLGEALGKLKDEEYDEHHLECLVYPEKFPNVWVKNNCRCERGKCIAACLFDAIEKVDGIIVINPGLCTGCARCVEACEEGNLILSKDTLRAIELVKEQERPVYALMAPAYVGQFGDDVTPGKLRTALKKIGFAGMIEVATFADILTLKESLEFERNIKKKEDFQLTSCCCPVWIALIRRRFKEIVSHLPPAVSPMIAAGRIVKKLHPNSGTIFIGPCLAKKSEAKEPDVEGAVDCVLTFEELRDIFDAGGLVLHKMPEETREHSSSVGRMYGAAGGVSSAVKAAVERIKKDDAPGVEAKCACGVKDCKELLEKILRGEVEGNFYEGMGCKEGCIGGPKVLKKPDIIKEKLDSYVENAEFKTPIDNPYVIDLLHRLGFEDVKEFIKNSDILTRDFREE